MSNLRKASLYALAALGLLVFCLWYYSLSIQQSFGFQISFLSIGQGDATYIQAPNGRQMIVDGGPRGSLIKPLAEVMPADDKSIDVIIVTNPDTDHYAGFLDLLKTYSVGVVVESPATSTTKTYKDFQELILEKQIPRVIATKGTTITLDEQAGVVYTVLFPEGSTIGLSHNDASLVGRLVYGETSVLLTGDTTVASESRIIATNKPEDIQSDILKVAHHGSRTSSGRAFLDIVRPEYGIISAGKNNRYNHPHTDVVSRLKSLGIEVLVTKDTGTVTFTSDGTSLELVSSQK